MHAWSPGPPLSDGEANQTTYVHYVPLNPEPPESPKLQLQRSTFALLMATPSHPLALLVSLSHLRR